MNIKLLVPLVGLLAGVACSAPTTPQTASTTTTSWETAPVHYIPPVECRTPPSQLQELRRQAATQGAEALEAELERQTLKLSQCNAPMTVPYENCAAVKAAGKAPIYRGDPGFGEHLDRDGDGVGCVS